MKILVTGAAGFIGAFLVKRLLEATEDEIIGLDNLNDYYDVSLKEARLDMLKPYSKFKFIKGDLSDKSFIDKLFDEYHFDIVVNLAAQAGVDTLLIILMYISIPISLVFITSLKHVGIIQLNI